MSRSLSPSPSQRLQSLGSLPMCIAVDRSGSTIGSTLSREIEVIQELQRLRKDPNYRPIVVLPWCDQAYAPITLDKHSDLQSIVSGGGTHPSVLYKSEHSLNALQESGIWVLMTDGQIHDNLVEEFATRTADVGLHNKATIIIVFGETSQGRPAACDISVGIAIYAVVPDCLFLFHDITTGIVRIMQAKGRFKQLIPVTGQQRPKLIVNQYTGWAELPRTSYEDLFNVELSMIRKLDPHEMALENGLIVNVPDMLAGNVDKATMERIIKDRDNLRSLALASKTRGTGKDLAGWLKSQQKPVPGKITTLKDIEDRAQCAISTLLEALKNGASAETLEKLRERVRIAHESNLSDFWAVKAKADDDESSILYTNHRLQSHCNALESSENEGTSSWAIKQSNKYTVERCGYDSCQSADEMPPMPPMPPLQSYTPKVEAPLRKRKATRKRRSRFGYYSRTDDRSETGSLLSVDGDADPLMLPGYRRPNVDNDCKGRCMLCHSTSVLTVLLKSPPPISTNGFPSRGSKVKIAFPFAMGSFAEMDVLSFFITCDACAFHLLRIGTCPNSDVILDALCLVCLPENQGLWLESVDNAIKGRFDIADLLAISVAIMEAKLTENENRTAPQLEKNLFRECIEWAIRNLATVLEVPLTLSPAFANGASGSTVDLRSLIFTEHFVEPESYRNRSLLLLRYPVSGFVVLLKVLRLLGFPLQREEALLCQKLIFEIIEKYTILRAAGRSPPPAAEILGLSDKSTDTNMSNNFDASDACEKEKLSLSGLIQHGLLEQGCLKRLDTCPAFETVKSRGGPAITVFLHTLLRNRQPYPDTISCFNAFKQLPQMQDVMRAPLSISGDAAAQLISRM